MTRLRATRQLALNMNFPSNMHSDFDFRITRRVVTESCFSLIIYARATLYSLELENIKTKFSNVPRFPTIRFFSLSLSLSLSFSLYCNAECSTLIEIRLLERGICVIEKRVPQ